jgi:hypothetical protein
MDYQKETSPGCQSISLKVSSPQQLNTFHLNMTVSRSDVVISLQYTKTSAPSFFAIIWQRHHYLTCKVGSGYPNGAMME